ncbi:MAG TPA: hypothetical protein VJT33_02635 [bacterium]|nr:hypothetical protein [bacterium]
MPALDEASLREIWTALALLERRAHDLRMLSQYEPLKKARPDYPHTGVGRSYDDEVRNVFADLARAFAEARRLLPAALPDGDAPPGAVADETPPVLADRLAALETLASRLARDAFEPLPRLPPHAPPYLVTLPGHDVPSSKALILGNSILEIVGVLRNAIVAAANAKPE